MSNNGNATAADTATDLTAINILTYVFLGVVMFGIGAAVHLGDLRTVLRSRKLALAVGLVSQYLVMPAAARLIASGLLRMPDVDAAAIILIGCCPGGAVSNAFAYFAKADIALSISMTAISNALAFGTLPLLLFLWTRGLADSPFGQDTVPFLDIFASLLIVLVPAGIGVALRHKNDKWAGRAEKLGATSSAVLIMSSIFVGLIQNGSTLADAELVPWRNAAAVALVAPIGCALCLAARTFNGRRA